MRYFQEYRHKFSNASGVAIDAGKKLLGYIANQKRLSGVDSMVQRISVQDEEGAVWIVEARFDKDIPSVRIFPPNSDSAVCELYVESGLLDLGPNIAADAGQRFNRGVPVFNDAPATLHFGDGVDCPPGEAGLNGRVRTVGNGLESDCLPSEGSSVQSRLTDPIKKQAQALLPASCWSGLMQRYVQAVYGGASLDYAVEGDMLMVEGVSVGGIGASGGLVKIGSDLLFVFVGSGPVLASNVKFKSSCGESVYRMWQRLHPTLSASQSSKLLTVALSEAFPGDATVIGDVGSLRFTSPYGWQFDPSAPEAHAVVADSSNATLKKLVVSLVGGAHVATVSDVEVAALPPRMAACTISGPAMPSSILCATDAASSVARGGVERGSRYEHPVGCYYDEGLVVVRFIHDNSSGVDVANMEGGECGAGYSPDQRQNIAIPGETGYNYVASVIENQGDFFPADFYTNFGYQHIGNAVTGVFAKRGSTVLWSTVEDTPVLYMKTTSELSPYAEYVSGSLAFNVTFSEYAPAGTMTSFVELPYGPNGYSGVNHQASLLGGDPLCGRAFDGYFMNCGDWHPPPITETCEEGESPHIEFSWTLDQPIAILTKRGASVSIITGAAHEIALPRGDCSAMVCARINRKGCYPRFGMDAGVPYQASHTVRTETHYSGGHAFDSPPASDPSGCIGAGSVVGAATLKCNGAVKQTVPFSGGSAEHLSACTTCWVPGMPIIDNVQVAAFMQTTTKMVTDTAESAEKSGGLKLFGDAGTNTFTGDWAFTPGGSFEFLIDSDYGEFIRTHITSDFNNAPTATESADGEASIEERALIFSPILQQGFTYAARSGLLDAKTRWADPFAFGASINMDRETITGGYSPVSTPSFVGWA